MDYHFNAYQPSYTLEEAMAGGGVDSLTVVNEYLKVWEVPNGVCGKRSLPTDGTIEVEVIAKRTKRTYAITFLEKKPIFFDRVEDTARGRVLKTLSRKHTRHALETYVKSRLKNPSVQSAMHWYNPSLKNLPTSFALATRSRKIS
ncbi:hypothetical protein [Parashewanella tropica]|uniref:hypothetical protein n=1 Tax=Parashewanella tropica TaxID=2547970 RepID=UPI0010595DE8|nr:hypothetical protein [Parashewanella tropica]